MEPNKTLRMLGLAARAGKVITGIDLCEKACKKKNAFLIILAEDAKESTKRLFSSYSIPMITVLDKERLGKFTGKEYRSVAVVCDKQFADTIRHCAQNEQ